MLNTTTAHTRTNARHTLHTNMLTSCSSAASAALSTSTSPSSSAHSPGQLAAAAPSSPAERCCSSFCISGQGLPAAEGEPAGETPASGLCVTSEAAPRPFLSAFCGCSMRLAARATAAFAVRAEQAGEVEGLRATAAAVLSCRSRARFCCCNCRTCAQDRSPDHSRPLPCHVHRAGALNMPASLA